MIDTVAGTGNGGFSEDGVPATSASLNNPGGVAVDSEGNIYIADSSNHRVRKVDASGTISTIAGTGTAGYTGDGGPATLAQLNNPYRLALDSVGNLYIVDYSNDCIRMVDVSGEISTVAGGRGNGYMGDGGPATSARLSYPDGVAVDSGGNLYIADKGNHRIRKVDTSGTISTVAGSGVRGYSGDGGDAELAQLNSPTGVAVDGSGNLYISDTSNHRIRRIDVMGKISTVAGVGEVNYWGDGVPATSAYLNRPIGIAVDNGGNVYIVDSSNFRIRKIDTSGIISTIAGTGRFGYSGDGGPATSADLHGPYGIAVDSSGNLYIADVFSHRIRKLSAQTVVASAASSIPEVGVDDTITLTVKNALGNTDTSFDGMHEVTISGYLQAPDGSYGRFNGTALSASSSTTSVAFASGVATVNLALNKAGEQTINISVADMVSPEANALIIMPVAGSAASMALTTDIKAPASSGGQFAQQPVITLLDAYGNKSAGDNSTVVTASKKDGGAWTLTGPATARASAGVVTFAGLGATNTAMVTEAKLSFETEGLPPVESTAVTLPIYTGKLISQLRPVPHDPDHPHGGDESGKFKKIDSNVYLTNEPYADLLFTTKGADGLSVFVDDIRKGIAARGPSGNLVVRDGAEWLKIDSADPLMDTSMFRLASQPVPATGIRIDISANKTTEDDLESVVLLQAPTVISLDAPHILETGKTITINGHIDTKARLPITISTIQETINDYTDDQGQFSFVYTAPLSAVNEFIVVAAPGVEQQLLKSWGVIIYKPDRLPAPDGLKATAGDGEVVLSWEPVTGATYYDIYEGEASGSYQNIERITNFTGDYTFRGLTNNITRYYAVKAGNDEIESDYSEEVSATPEALSPSVPPQWPDGSELKASDITQTSMKLSWPTAADSVGVTGYRIYVNGTEHETVVGSVNVITVEGLSADTAYTVKVIAFNAEGKESNALTVSARTLPQPPDPDTEAPQWPDGSEMKASDITQTSVKLSWPTATDNVGVIGYRLYVNGTEHKTVGGSVNVTTVEGLSADTTYTFRVTAYDAAGNESEVGLSRTATTLSRPSSGSGGGWYISSNASLKTFEIWTDGKRLSLTPSFTMDTFSYRARTEAKQIEVRATADHAAAKVTWQEQELGGGIQIELQEGENIIPIIVQAEDGSRKTYTLVIEKLAPDLEEPKPPVASLADIEGHWAENDIKRAAAKGIVNGYPDGAFKPNNSVTRAEFTVMLAGALKLEGEGSSLTFADYEQIGGWAKKAAAQVVQAGIVNGYEDDSFRPNAYISRAEMAAMIARALKKELNAHASTDFADDEAIPQWAKGAIEAIRALGIVDGRGSNHFVPNETATRAEATVMLLRMLEQME